MLETNTHRSSPQQNLSLIPHKEQFSRKIEKTLNATNIQHIVHAIETCSQLSILRPMQKKALQAIATCIKKGHRKLFVKMPTGSGKTFVMSILIKILTENNIGSMTMIPSHDLANQTIGSLEGAHYAPNHIHYIHKRPGKKVSDKVYDFVHEVSPDFTGNAIMTYAGLNSVAKQDTISFKWLASLIGAVVSDEVHGALGEVTSTNIEEFHIQDMIDTEKALDTYNAGLIELGFTATPNNLLTSVYDNYECAYFGTLEEAIQEGSIVPPKFIEVGRAKLYWQQKKKQGFTQAELDEVAERFTDEQGRPMYVALTQEYKNILREKGGKGSAAGMCSTIRHAEIIRKYLETQGIRAVRVTSGNDEIKKGVSLEEAQEMIRADKADMMLIVNKDQGWDEPCIENIIWYYPSLSPRKILQGTGRGLRTNGPLKKYCNVLSPSAWDIDYIVGTPHNSPDNQVIPGGNNHSGTAVKNRYKGIKSLGSIMETMYRTGEMSKEYLNSEYNYIVEETAILPEIDKDGNVMIDGKIYKQFGGSTSAEHLWGVRSQTVTRRVYNQSDAWKEKYVTRAKSKRMPVQVVEETALQKILEQDIGLVVIGPTGRVMIDGKEYQWISAATPGDQLWGVDGHMAWKRVQCQSKKRKNTYMKIAKKKKRADVVEVEALKEILKKDIGMPILGDDGKILIEGKEYQRVGNNTPSEQLRGILGATARNRIGSMSSSWKKQHIKNAKKNGSGPVMIVERNILQTLLQEDIGIPVLGEDRKVTIDGKIYYGVFRDAQNTPIFGVSIFTVLGLIGKKSNNWKKAYMKSVKYSGRPVDAVELSVLQELLKKSIATPRLGTDGTVKIDGIIYQEVTRTTPSQNLAGIDPNIVRRLLKKKSSSWKKQYVRLVKKRGSQDAFVVEKGALQKLLDDYNSIPILGANGQVNIKGKIFQRVGFSVSKEQLYGQGPQTVNTKVKMQSAAWKKQYVTKARGLHKGIVDVVESQALKRLLGVI